MILHFPTLAGVSPKWNISVVAWKLVICLIYIYALALRPNSLCVRAYISGKSLVHMLQLYIYIYIYIYIYNKARSNPKKNIIFSKKRELFFIWQRYSVLRFALHIDNKFTAKKVLMVVNQNVCLIQINQQMHPFLMRNLPDKLLPLILIL